MPTDAELIARLRATNLQLIDMRNIIARDNDAWREWAGDVSGRPDWNGHDVELRALVMDRMSDRDMTIRYQQADLIARDKTIEALQKSLRIKREENAELRRRLALTTEGAADMESFALGLGRWK